MRRILTQCVLLLLCMPVWGTTWPGQSGNAVGYAAYGSLNATACGSFSSGTSWSAPNIVQNCTYSTAQTINCSYCEFISVDFNAGTGGTLITGSNILFLGDRFQSNDIQNYNVQISGGTNIYFLYDSVTPLASLYTSPPGSVWPSAGSGANTTTMTDNTNCVAVNDGYEYGINVLSGGPVYAYGLDIWGFGNAFIFYNTSTQMNVVNSWIHDAAQNNGVTGGNYHTDGIGYLNSGAGPSNVNVIGNTLASLGNTQMIAWQAATSGYSGLKHFGNYVSGDEYTVAMCAPGTTNCSNSNWTNNVLGTDVEPIYGPLYAGTVTWGSNSVWNCNTIAFRTGTTWSSGGGWTPTSGMNGQYWVANTTPNSTTDQGGNTVCASPSATSSAWMNQQVGTTSSGTAITFTNNGSSGITGLSVSLATGTQFSISANTCGSTLATSSSCTVTVKFAPTSQGPQTDTLQFATNMTSPSNSQPVALVGYAIPSSTPVAPSALFAMVH